MRQSTRKTPKSCPHKNLTRFEYPSFSGYKLSIQRRGFQLTRYFPTKRFGGWEAAENAALAARDKILARIEGMSDEELLSYFRGTLEKTEA